MPASNQPDAADLTSMSLVDLLDWREALAGQLDELIERNPRVAEARDMLTKTNAVIVEKARPDADAAYVRQGKSHGSLTIKSLPGVVVKADISQTVSWDQEKLKAIAGTLDWPTAQQLFKITFTVPEAVYKNMLPGELKDKLTDARTTKTGDIKINVERAAI